MKIETKETVLWTCFVRVHNGLQVGPGSSMVRCRFASSFHFVFSFLFTIPLSPPLCGYEGGEGVFITPNLKSTCLQPRYLGLYIKVGFGGLTFWSVLDCTLNWTRWYLTYLYTLTDPFAPRHRCSLNVVHVRHEWAALLLSSPTVWDFSRCKP